MEPWLYNSFCVWDFSQHKIIFMLLGKTNSNWMPFFWEGKLWPVDFQSQFFNEINIFIGLDKWGYYCDHNTAQLIQWVRERGRGYKREDRGSTETRVLNHETNTKSQVTKSYLYQRKIEMMIPHFFPFLLQHGLTFPASALLKKSEVWSIYCILYAVCLVEMCLTFTFLFKECFLFVKLSECFRYRQYVGKRRDWRGGKSDRLRIWEICDRVR